MAIQIGWTVTKNVLKPKAGEKLSYPDGLNAWNEAARLTREHWYEAVITSPGGHTWVLRALEDEDTT